MKRGNRQTTGLPTSWWGKTLMWAYIAGYHLHILLAAVWSWSVLPDFWTWQNYVAWQFIYAVVWPVWLVKGFL